MNLLRKYYDGLADLPIGGGIPDEDIPKMEYQRLFDAISETGGIAFQTEMQEIIRIVHEDFPSEELNLARQSTREYFKLFNEAMDKVIEQAQEISRLKEENERLRGEVSKCNCTKNECCPNCLP